MATTNLGRVSFVLKGAYDAETAYKRLDVVTMNHTSYAAKCDTTGHAPPDKTYWQPSGGRTIRLRGCGVWLRHRQIPAASTESFPEITSKV